MLEEHRDSQAGPSHPFPRFTPAQSHSLDTGVHSQPPPAPAAPALPLRAVLYPKSIPCHPKRLGLTHHGTHAQCRPCSLSRLCPQPSVWGHVPRGALWPTPNDRDLPALFMSCVLSAQCKSCNGEHRLSCPPQPLCSPGSLSSPTSHSTLKVPTLLSLAPTISPQTCQDCGILWEMGKYSLRML